ncbi:MAG: hypothetical protein AABX47_10105 [Nanoarchaeota archaeon]
MDRDQILEQLEAFELELCTEHLQHLVGLKEEINSAPIYEKYPELFSIDNVKECKKLVETTSGLEKRKNLYLLGSLIGSFMSEPLKELSDERDTFEAKAVVAVDGKDVPFRQIGIMISNEPKHSERKRLFELSLDIKKKMEAYDKKMLEEEWKLAKKTGFPDYTSIFSYVKDTDYDKMAVQMRKFLVDTDALFTKLIETEMGKIGVPTEDAAGYDISFWIRNPKFDPYFKKEQLAPSLKETLRGLGFDLDKQDNIKVDIEDRPGKVPRAFCMPLRIPEEVHLVIKPSGGQNDYKSMYHECGHSEHYANSSADLPFEFKHMGSHCVSETYAFTFEHIIMTEEWLSHHTKMDAATRREFLEFDMTVKLFFLRRYATKLLYELKLHCGDLTRIGGDFEPVKGKKGKEAKYKDMSECYCDMLSKACKVKIHPINWASDVDGGYYSADYLRAWMLEVQLQQHMRKSYGKDWMHKTAAGDFLLKLWKDANKPTPLELAKAFGYDTIDMGIMTEEVIEFFGRK